MKRNVSVEYDTKKYFGELTGYTGRICGAGEGEIIVDTVDELNIALRYHIAIRPMPGDADRWQVETVAGTPAGNCGVRRRYGTLEEAKAIAEKWAIRRFKIKEDN